MIPALVAAKSTAPGNRKNIANPGSTMSQNMRKAFPSLLMSVQGQQLSCSLWRVMRQHGLGKKKNRNVTQNPHVASQKLTGQVARGLGWKDLGHDRPRQSCFGQGGLDGPERASPCEDKNRSNRINLACPWCPLTVQQRLQRVCFTATVKTMQAEPRQKPLNIPNRPKRCPTCPRQGESFGTHDGSTTVPLGCCLKAAVSTIIPWGWPF